MIEINSLSLDASVNDDQVPFDGLGTAIARNYQGRQLIVFLVTTFSSTPLILVKQKLCINVDHSVNAPNIVLLVDRL